MIKKQHTPIILEQYEQQLLLKNNKRYQVNWKSLVLMYYTCGQNNKEIECLQFFPESLKLRQVQNDEPVNELIPLDVFNKNNPEEQLDFKCNCHGFTFANGKYFIDNYYVQSILDEEYFEVLDLQKINIGDFDIVCFKNKREREWIHSCKYQMELYIQKEGVRKFSVHSTLEEILAIEEYSNSEVHYFSHNDRTCPGICRNGISESYIKTFANS